MKGSVLPSLLFYIYFEEMLKSKKLLKQGVIYGNLLNLRMIYLYYVIIKSIQNILYEN
jgi:hypothetical protein